MIAVENVEVVYNKGTLDEKMALKGVSMKILPGEFVIIVGSNGAGKSTLLKVITGEVKPLRGNCKVMGSPVNVNQIFRKASIVCQDPNAGVFPNLTIEENLVLARRKGLRGLTFGRIDRNSIELLKSTKLSLERDLKRKASKLSGGQKQALALVMAVSSDPELLLLDEHTAALDPKSTETIMELTERINKKLGTTVLMITHDMAIAESYGKRVIVMEDGRVSAVIDKTTRKVVASELKAMIGATPLLATD